MEKTAVEWLEEQIKSKAVNLPTNTKENRMAKGIYVDCLMMVKQAKEMEKEQIISAWHNGYNNQSPMIDEENCGQQYYNQTFKQD